MFESMQLACVIDTKNFKKYIEISQNNGVPKEHLIKMVTEEVAKQIQVVVEKEYKE